MSDLTQKIEGKNPKPDIWIKIGNEIKGVDKTYAVQAGRELRVMVKPDEVDDLTSYSIAREIKEKIENEMQYPGTIKVTVVRETRACEEAK